MICSHCFNKIPDESKFCMFCGKKIDKTSEKALSEVKTEYGKNIPEIFYNGTADVSGKINYLEYKFLKDFYYMASEDCYYIPVIVDNIAPGDDVDQNFLPEDEINQGISQILGPCGGYTHLLYCLKGSEVRKQERIYKRIDISYAIDCSSDSIDYLMLIIDIDPSKAKTDLSVLGNSEDRWYKNVHRDEYIKRHNTFEILYDGTSDVYGKVGYLDYTFLHTFYYIPEKDCYYFPMILSFNELDEDDFQYFIPQDFHIDFGADFWNPPVYNPFHYLFCITGREICEQEKLIREIDVTNNKGIDHYFDPDFDDYYKLYLKLIIAIDPSQARTDLRETGRSEDGRDIYFDIGGQRWILRE